MNIIGIIPARYASTRFPGKPLHPIAGKPLIAHVVERCREAASLAEVRPARAEIGTSRCIDCIVQPARCSWKSLSE